MPFFMALDGVYSITPTPFTDSGGIDEATRRRDRPRAGAAATQEGTEWTSV
jgi:hypothetical protein